MKRLFNTKNTSKNLTNLKLGFTLIELLIVIAILGILTTAVLVAINPLEQFARARDSGRLGSVDQLGHAIQSYYTAQDGTYLPTGTGWITGATASLRAAGEIKTAPVNPSGPGYTKGCETAGLSDTTGGFCYQQNGTDAIVYAHAESTAQKTKANCGTGIAWIVWSSADGRTGLVCTGAGDPNPGILNPK